MNWYKQAQMISNDPYAGGKTVKSVQQSAPTAPVFTKEIFSNEEEFKRISEEQKIARYLEDFFFGKIDFTDPYQTMVKGIMFGSLYCKELLIGLEMICSGLQVLEKEFKFVNFQDVSQKIKSFWDNSPEIIDYLNLFNTKDLNIIDRVKNKQFPESEVQKIFEKAKQHLVQVRSFVITVMQNLFSKNEIIEADEGGVQGEVLVKEIFDLSRTVQSIYNRKVLGLEEFHGNPQEFLNNLIGVFYMIQAQYRKGEKK